MARPLEILLTVAASVVGLAFFQSVPYWPKDWTVRPEPPPLELPVGLRPSVLANLKPVPTLNLTFPSDVATIVRRSGINGETGLIPTAASITTFRLREGGDLVSVAAPTGVEAVRPAPGSPGVYRVRGADAVAFTARGNVLIRWTENGVTFEMSSRTVDVDRLAALANLLR